MSASESDSEKELINQIVDIHLEFMNGKVGMCHTHIEFWFCGHDNIGGDFNWYEDDGTTSMIHPDLDGLDWGKSLDIELSYDRRINKLLRQARDHDEESGLPMRNVYDMKVYRDGRHEFQFYHDADLAAEQLRRTEESERKEAEAKKKQQAERAAQLENGQQEPVAPGIATETAQERALFHYKVRWDKIFKHEDNIWHAEEFLRYQAALAAPEGWEEVRIEMIRVNENQTRMDQWYRLKGESAFQPLHAHSSMDVVDAIEHWLGRKDEGEHRKRSVRFTLSPDDVKNYNAIRYEWDIEAQPLQD